MPNIPIEKVNGHGLDLSGLRATPEQKAAAYGQAMRQAGLICGCGERIRDRAVQFYIVGEQQMMTPQGPQMAIGCALHVLCSPDCELAAGVSEHAIARREVKTAAITWLDEPAEPAEG